MGNRDQYPCGCEYIRHADGTYTHFVHPECKYDGRLIGNDRIKGYRYVAFEEAKYGA